MAEQQSETPARIEDENSKSDKHEWGDTFGF